MTYLGSKEWANEVLKIGIASAHGKNSDVPSMRWVLALYCKKDLLAHGFRWQHKILGHQIHRAQKLGLLLQPEKADPTNEVRERGRYP